MGSKTAELKMASKTAERRVLVRDLGERMKALEQRMDEFTQALSRLDERIQKIADSLAVQTSRWNS